jgi:hypothetical protein
MIMHFTLAKQVNSRQKTLNLLALLKRLGLGANVQAHKLNLNIARQSKQDQNPTLQT